MPLPKFNTKKFKTQTLGSEKTVQQLTCLPCKNKAPGPRIPAKLKRTNKHPRYDGQRHVIPEPVRQRQVDGSLGLTGQQA